MTSESEVLNYLYGSGHSKTMSDVVDVWKTIDATEEIAIESIKKIWPNVTDWTI